MNTINLSMNVNTTKSKSSDKTYSAPALEKGLDIIEFLSKQSSGFKLKEIAQNLDKSVSEIFRMVAVLEKRGYLYLDNNDDKYYLSLKLFEITHQHSPIQKLTKAAAAEMEALTKHIDQSCHLTICFNNKVMVIIQKDSDMDRRFTIRLGASSPLLNSCSGHIFLSFVEDDIQQSIFESLHEQATPKELTRLSSRVKQQGYERMPSKQIQGVEDLGFPVFNYENKIVACLVVPFIHYLGDSKTVDIEQAITATQQTVQNISAKLAMKN